MANLNLYLYGSNGQDYNKGVVEFDEAVENISKKVDSKIADDNFKNVINKLHERERRVYIALGQGSEEKGKEVMRDFANQYYIDEPVRAEVIKLTNELFKPKILSEDGNLLELVWDKNSNNFRMKVDGNWVKDGQKYFEEYCEKWNKTVISYKDHMDEIRNLLFDKEIITENTYNGVLKTFEIIHQNLNEVGQKNISLLNLQQEFIKALKSINGSFANVIGNVTEGAKFEIKNKVTEEIEKEVGKITFKRGDNIQRGETGFSTQAKADGVFEITGKLVTLEGENIKSITIPSTLKYHSAGQIKFHSGSLRSISQIISQEGEIGEEYANYFANLALNMIYYIHFSDKQSEEVTLVLRKILNKFAFSFIYGNSLEDRPYGNALFFAGFFPDVQEGKGKEFSANYFTPVSNILQAIYDHINIGIKKRDFVMNWAGFNFLSKFKLIMQMEIGENETQKKLTFSPIIVDKEFDEANKKTTKFLKYEADSFRKERRAEREGLDYGTVQDLFNKLSSKIGEQEINFPRNIITGEGIRKISVFKKQHGGIIL